MTYKSVVLADSPTFLWMLDETSGTDAVDATSNANDGVYLNHYTQGVTGPLFDSKAVSMAGPGSDSVVYCGNYLNTGTTLSAETWFNTTTTLGGSLIQLGSASDYTVTAYMTNNGKVHFGIWDSSANTRAVADSTSTYNDGNWHHIVGTYDASTHAIVLYVDGTQVGTASQSTYSDDGGYWAIGGADLTGWPGTWTNSGLASEFSAFAVYPAVLTSTQVTAHYAASGYGSSSTPATANGVTAHSASAAPAGSVLARAKAVGVTAHSASSAPAGSVLARAKAVGVTAHSASSAPAGTVDPYRLFRSTNGPSTAVSYSGNFISGVVFAVAENVAWFEGYWWWVASSGQSTSPVKCALWSPTSLDTGVLVDGSVVTSGTLTAGEWNFIPLAAPIPLAPGLDPVNSEYGSAYIAAVGCNGNFPDTSNWWGSGDPGADGISNGPLFAYSGKSGTKPSPLSLPQGCFTTGGSDPSTTMPQGESGTDNFWVDVQVTSVVPEAYAGTYRLWPNKAEANPETSADAAVAYVLGTEFTVSDSVVPKKVWYYSPGAAESLATWAGVYAITGEDSGTLMVENTSPSWSGAAASGWISATFDTAVLLSPGDYKICIYNSAGAGDGWSAKDASSNYWSTGAGSSGIKSGPIAAPKLSDATTSYIYDSSGASNTPAYSGLGSESGQNTFAVSGPQYPYLYVDGLAQNYWVDVEVATPAPATANGVTATSASSAPAGHAGVSVTANGVTAHSVSAAPAGHAGVSATVNGVTATSASSAPVGHAGVSVTANGVTATSVSAAPTGAVTAGGAAVATGVTATSVSSAPAGSVKVRATAIGVTATSVSAAPAGSAKARATANGVTAHSASAAAAGSATGTSTTPPVQAGIIKIVRLSPGKIAISRTV